MKRICVCLALFTGLSRVFLSLSALLSFFVGQTEPKVLRFVEM